MSEGSRPPEGSSSASCCWGSSSEVLAPPLLVSRHQRAGGICGACALRGSDPRGAQCAAQRGTRGATPIQTLSGRSPMNGSPLTWPGTDDGRNQSQGPVVRRTLPAAVWADGRTKGLITRTTAAEARPPGCAVSMRKQRGPSRCWGYLLRVVHDSALRERWPLSRCTPRARARGRERDR